MAVPYLTTLLTDFSIDALISGGCSLAILQVDGVMSIELWPVQSLLDGVDEQWQRYEWNHLQ